MRLLLDHDKKIKGIEHILAAVSVVLSNWQSKDHHDEITLTILLRLDCNNNKTKGKVTFSDFFLSFNEVLCLCQQISFIKRPSSFSFQPSMNNKKHHHNICPTSSSSRFFLFLVHPQMTKLSLLQEIRSWKPVKPLRVKTSLLPGDQTLQEAWR